MSHAVKKAANLLEVKGWTDFVYLRHANVNPYPHLAVHYNGVVPPDFTGRDLQGCHLPEVTNAYFTNCSPGFVYHHMRESVQIFPRLSKVFLDSNPRRALNIPDIPKRFAIFLTPPYHVCIPKHMAFTPGPQLVGKLWVGVYEQKLAMEKYPTLADMPKSEFENGYSEMEVRQIIGDNNWVGTFRVSENQRSKNLYLVV